MAPLDLYQGSLSVPFFLDNDVFLSKRPSWVLSDEILKDLSILDREILRRGRYALIKEYEANSLGDPDRAWRGSKSRSKQSAADEAIQLADLALWLAKPAAVGFSRMVVAFCPSGTWNRVQFGSADQLLSHGLDLSNKLTKNDLGRAKNLHAAMSAMPRDGAVWIAAKTLWLALTERDWAVRYLLLWTVLESLFGVDNAVEVTYRLSQRVSLFLSPVRANAKDFAAAVKASYGWRSKAVHRMKLANLSQDKSRQLMHSVEMWVRGSLTRILMDSALIEKFNGTKREEYLDELVFSA